jgi:phage FluMu gp28-like protein
LLERAINQGKDVWWVFPTYNNANVHWRKLKKMLEGSPFVRAKKEQEKYLEFKSGGSITFKSSDRPDNLLGAGLGYVVLDEAAMMPGEVWSDVISPMLMDGDGGGAMLISTPRGMGNYFYQAYQWGQSDKEPDWASWRLPTSTNPYIDQRYIAAQKRLMVSHKYRQEILAEFLASAGGAFNGVENIMTLDMLTAPDQFYEDWVVDEETGLTVPVEYLIGVDWGRKNDKTVISVFEKQSGHQVYLEQFTDIGYDTQKDRVAKIIEVWEPTRAYVESNNMGGPQSEQLRSELGSVIHPVYMTNPIKIRMVENFALNIERERIQLLKADTELGIDQAGQMSAFALHRTNGGTTITYRAPRGIHDDIVIANILANKDIRVKRKMARFGSAPNPFYT